MHDRFGGTKRSAIKLMEKHEDTNSLCRSCQERPVSVQKHSLCPRCYQRWLKSPDHQRELLVKRSRAALMPPSSHFIHAESVSSPDEARRIYVEQEEAWQDAIRQANQHYRNLGDEAAIVLAQIKSFISNVTQLEVSAVLAGVSGIPERPSFMNEPLLPLKRKQQEMLAKQVDERFKAINNRVLAAEQIDCAPSFRNRKAREVGKYARLIYERSKPLFWHFGKARSHRYYKKALVRAIMENPGNPHLRFWLSKRGMCPP